MVKMLVLCTGNSCRSQMAEGFLKSFNKEFIVFSAGTHPEKEINSLAVAVMKEKGIDISKQYPKNAEIFVNDPFDYVITVCDNAKEVCPVFSGSVKNRIHISFEDPALAKGSEIERLEVYRKVRDEIESEFKKLFIENYEE